MHLFEIRLHHTQLQFRILTYISVANSSGERPSSDISGNTTRKGKLLRGIRHHISAAVHYNTIELVVGVMTLYVRMPIC